MTQKNKLYNDKKQSIIDKDIQFTLIITFQ